MAEKKPKKKTENNEKKEHKPNWRETHASAEDILKFLNKNILLRHNVITGRQEFRVPMQDEFESLGMVYPTGATPLDEWRSLTEWHEVNDRLVNSLWNMLSSQKDVSEPDIRRVINSDFVQLFNPFVYYLNRLPPWDENTNPILDLSMTVSVAGSTDEQLLFYFCLRKWLVAMVAGWIDDDVVNQEILVFVGRQGIFKTTWFNSLMPPDLQQYFHSNTSFGNMTKDEVLKLSQYGLICCEELDTMKPAEMNRLKWAVTTMMTDERRAYAHYSERRKHIASYCGTGNNLQFIDDDTGTRRWLPFEVENIRSPREFPFDHDAIFSQAFALYNKGMKYWFDEKELKLLMRHNERFEVPRLERELISKYYRPPRGDERGEFVSSGDILQTISGNLAPRLTTNKLGRAMTALGFVGVRSKGQRGYNVVAYTAEEIKSNKSLLAFDAKPESDSTAVNISELFDTNDTLF
ncbi:MAG: hypothetical protein IKD75_00320 [Prevotella sp.]|nr:hypothetical protein [Prevotella sp.]